MYFTVKFKILDQNKIIKLVIDSIIRYFSYPFIYAFVELGGGVDDALV